MIKLLLSGVLIALMLSAHATPQELYWHRVHFRNACSYPVQITVYSFNNSDEMDKTKQKNLQPGEVATYVLIIVNLTDKVELIIPEDYKMEIVAADKSISLDKAQFIKVLQKTPSHARFWHYIYNEGDPFHEWTISDPSLCP
ncbi:MAG: hypothetical protein LBF61_05205 [Azoarcus sp.]|jgi:hypothetical protein|nr:hypothetical protein [Azoarcus sp.]